MTDVNELLSLDAASVERPKPYPAGTYPARISRHEFGKSSQKQTDYVRFHFAILGPDPNLPPEDFNGVDLSKRELRDDFYITPDAMFRIREFLEIAGLSTSGHSFKELIANQVNGRMVNIIVGKQASQREGDTSVYNVINGYTKA